MYVSSTKESRDTGGAPNIGLKKKDKGLIVRGRSGFGGKILVRLSYNNVKFSSCKSQIFRKPKESLHSPIFRHIQSFTPDPPKIDPGHGVDPYNLPCPSATSLIFYILLSRFFRLCYTAVC
jgi:hypothetical protein